MAGSWFNDGLVAQMNDMFMPGAKIKDTGKKFRLKHGNNGHGTSPNTKPYKFGGFAVDVTDMAGKKAVQAGKEAKWLIDTGTRHFEDASITAIENAIIDSLSRVDAELPIVFKKGSMVGPGQKATADVTRSADGGYVITIHCAP
jgi:hypothetical protein